MAGGFHSLGLLPELLKAIDDQNWLLPTDVQDEAIPLILGGGDVMVASETGTGKTAAFTLPILQCVSERLRGHSSDDENQSKKKPKLTTSTTGIEGSITKPTHDCKINENDRDPRLIIDADGYGASAENDKVWIGCRATHGVKTGKYYYEVTLTKPASASGICRLGWSSMAAHYELGKDAYGFGYGGTAMKSYNNTFVAYGVKYSEVGTIIGCCIDRLQNTISYAVNGVHQGKAFDIPATLINTVFFPAFVFKGAGARVNFGKLPFQHQPADYCNMYQPKVSTDIVSWNSSEAFSTVTSAPSSTSGSGSGNPSGGSGNNNAVIHRHPLAIIIEPSRELAEQVYTNINDLSIYLTNPKLRCLLITGGSGGLAAAGATPTGNAANTTTQKEIELDQKKILKLLKSEGCDILVGTLGKMNELVKNQLIDLSHVRFFILDEADRLADADNLKMIMTLYEACPVGGSGENRLQVCFFSATLHSFAIKNLSEKLCHNPTWVDLKGIDSVPDTVHHVVCHINLDAHLKYLTQAKVHSVTDEVHTKEVVAHITNTIQSTTKGSQTYQNQNQDYFFTQLRNTKLPLNELKSQLIKMLKQQLCVQIIDKFQMSQCMIFCRTNLDCDNLETFLCTLGGGKAYTKKMETGKEHAYSCAVLGGMRSMEERRRSLEAFKSGDVRFLICTDIAARGIDVAGLPYVINMTLPDEAENYIHRIGRVGRTSKMGLAISIVAPSLTATATSSQSSSSSGDSAQSEREQMYTETSSCPCCSGMEAVVTSSSDTALYCSTHMNVNTRHPAQSAVSLEAEGGSKDWKEKVWFHTCGNRGKGCYNRELKTKGGCTVWYDEASLLDSIKERLHLDQSQPFPELSLHDFSLPTSLAGLGIVYGEDSLQTDDSTLFGGAVSSAQMQERLKKLAETVKSLSSMEFEAQNMFLSYQTQFISQL